MVTAPQSIRWGSASGGGGSPVQMTDGLEMTDNVWRTPLMEIHDPNDCTAGLLLIRTRALARSRRARRQPARHPTTPPTPTVITEPPLTGHAHASTARSTLPFIATAFRPGRASTTSRCSTRIPTTRCASASSLGTWNGTACQTGHRERQRRRRRRSIYRRPRQRRALSARGSTMPARDADRAGRLRRSRITHP